MEWDESQEFPVHIFKEMGKLGLMGVLVPEEYGGSGLGYYEYNTIIQEIAKVCGSIGLSLAAHNSLCTGHILTFGNEEQKKKYLPKLATAEFIGAWGLTEANTGSDAGNMKTTAVKDGDDWIINVSILVFPEGGRTYGEMDPFKDGAAYIAIKAGVPIVPIGLTGVREILPRGGNVVQGGPVAMRIGEPIPTLDLTLSDRTALTQRLEHEVRGLIGEKQPEREPSAVA